MNNTNEYSDCPVNCCVIYLFNYVMFNVTLSTMSSVKLSETILNQCLLSFIFISMDIYLLFM